MAKQETVYYDGAVLIVDGVVMDVMKLLPGQSVSKQQLRQIIELNAAAFSEHMKLRKEVGLDAPDTTELDKLLLK